MHATRALHPDDHTVVDGIPHSDRTALERDHARFVRLKRAGYEVLALTWRQVAGERANVEATIRSLLARSAAARLI